MPTGYTEGIFTGDTKTFKQFALKCMKGMGACVHLREEPFDDPYKERTPSDYHITEIQNAKEGLKRMNEMSDKELTKEIKKELLDSKKYHIKKLKENSVMKIKFDNIKEAVLEYRPPTPDHEGVKRFMLEQLNTEDFNWGKEHHQTELEKIEDKIKYINPIVAREKKVAKYNKDLSYHLEGHSEELKRCASSNRWVDQFIKSIA